eukprot:990250-Amphidinium_carterae.1
MSLEAPLLDSLPPSDNDTSTFCRIDVDSTSTARRKAVPALSIRPDLCGARHSRQQVLLAPPAAIVCPRVASQ